MRQTVATARREGGADAGLIDSAPHIAMPPARADIEALARSGIACSSASVRRGFGAADAKHSRETPRRCGQTLVTSRSTRSASGRRRRVAPPASSTAPIAMPSPVSLGAGRYGGPLEAIQSSPGQSVSSQEKTIKSGSSRPRPLPAPSPPSGDAERPAALHRPSAAPRGQRPSAAATLGGAEIGRRFACGAACPRSAFSRFGRRLASHRAASRCASRCHSGCARRAAARTAYRVSSAPTPTSALQRDNISARGRLGVTESFRRPWARRAFLKCG